jgi:hypothetical protein
MDTEDTGQKSEIKGQCVGTSGPNPEWDFDKVPALKWLIYNDKH